MNLSGNKWMQKREVEKRMQIHWKNLETKTSTGASWREESPRKSMSNNRRDQHKQKQINEQNEKLIGKLYEILKGSSGRPYSPQRKKKGMEPHEITRQIQIQSRQMREERNNKRIGDANLQLLEAITTVQSTHNPVSLEKEYLERKRVVERLRQNTSSTALHLLTSPTVLNRPKSAPKERPKSAGSLPSWYSSLANKVEGKEKISRIHPYLQGVQYNEPHPPTIPSPIYPSQKNVPQSNVGLTVQTSFDSSLPSPAMTPSAVNSLKNDNPMETSLELHQQQQQLQQPLEENENMPMNHPPRKVLLTEIDMRGMIQSSSLSSPTRENTSSRKNKSVSQLSSSHSNETFNLPNPAIFVVRVYDVGRFQGKNLQPMSSGLIVESKLLPETEKSLCYELFLPIKQLRALIDLQHQDTSIYDSLGRKLKRLKCLDRELGLYSDLSNSLPASFLEQLCDLVLRSIETVITPKYHHHHRQREQEEGQEEQQQQQQDDDDSETRRRKSYSVKIRMKSSSMN